MASLHTDEGECYVWSTSLELVPDTGEAPVLGIPHYRSTKPEACDIGQDTAKPKAVQKDRREHTGDNTTIMGIYNERIRN